MFWKDDSTNLLLWVSPSGVFARRNVFYLLLVLEARAAVDITVVRKVFLLDKTFDLLCPSAAVGFTFASVGSFR